MTVWSRLCQVRGRTTDCLHTNDAHRTQARAMIFDEKQWHTGKGSNIKRTKACTTHTAICCQFSVTPTLTPNLRRELLPTLPIQSICKQEWPEFIGKQQWLNRKHSNELIPLSTMHFAGRGNLPSATIEATFLLWHFEYRTVVFLNSDNE